MERGEGVAPNNVGMATFLFDPYSSLPGPRWGGVVATVLPTVLLVYEKLCSSGARQKHTPSSAVTGRRSPWKNWKLMGPGGGEEKEKRKKKRGQADRQASKQKTRQKKIVRGIVLE